MLPRDIVISTLLILKLFGSMVQGIHSNTILHRPIHIFMVERPSFLVLVFFKGRAGFATSPLLADEIANVRERLLDFFMNEVIDIGGSCRVEVASHN